MTENENDPERRAIERVVRPIVEGQIRCFLKAHPAIHEAVDWKHPYESGIDAIVNSIGKRLTRELVCKNVRERIRQALEQS